MPPKKNTKHKDPPLPGEEGATDSANELAEPPSSDQSSGDSHVMTLHVMMMTGMQQCAMASSV
jgi:hypothetical protein